MRRVYDRLAKNVLPLGAVLFLGTACTGSSEGNKTTPPKASTPSVASEPCDIKPYIKPGLQRIEQIKDNVYRNLGSCVGLYEPASQASLGDGVQTGAAFTLLCRDDITPEKDVFILSATGNGGNVRIAPNFTSQPANPDLITNLQPCTEFGTDPGVPIQTPTSAPASPNI